MSKASAARPAEIQRLGQEHRQLGDAGADVQAAAAGPEAGSELARVGQAGPYDLRAPILPEGLAAVEGPPAEDHLQAVRPARVGHDLLGDAGGVGREHEHPPALGRVVALLDEVRGVALGRRFGFSISGSSDTS